MQIELTAEQREFVRRAVETGRAECEEAAVRQALDLWVERERQREELLAELDVAEAQLARGEGRTYASGKELAEEIHRRGMARLAAAKSKSR